MDVKPVTKLLSIAEVYRHKKNRTLGKVRFFLFVVDLLFNNRQE